MVITPETLKEARELFGFYIAEVFDSDKKFYSRDSKLLEEHMIKLGYKRDDWMLFDDKEMYKETEEI